MDDSNKKLSKFLSYVLRHRPDEIGLVLDDQGWASVSELIERSRTANVGLNEELLKEIVLSNDKKRFALSDDGTRIRASQGHSIQVDLALEPVQPPAVLYHGTASRFLDAIRVEGLKAMSRQHVHLSADEATAIKVGQRHGKPVVLQVLAADMWLAGRLFYLSQNGVWLTESVEPTYLVLPT